MAVRKKGRTPAYFTATITGVGTRSAAPRVKLVKSLYHSIQEQSCKCDAFRKGKNERTKTYRSSVMVLVMALTRESIGRTKDQWTVRASQMHIINDLINRMGENKNLFAHTGTGVALASTGPLHLGPGVHTKQN